MPPLLNHLRCSQCNCTESMFWKTTGDNQQLCYDCSEPTLKAKTETDCTRKVEDRKAKTRKSTRSTRYSIKNGNSTTTGTNQSTSIATGRLANTKPSGRGRRNLNRRPPVKTPVIPASTRHVNSLFYKGSYIQIGDIVSLCNSHYDIFYAQICGLMVDSFCEKSAVITWLLPTQSSPPPCDGFDPSTYIIGPEEEHPRLLSCMEFVMHAPSDYFHCKTTPYPTVQTTTYNRKYGSHGGFIWTNIDSKGALT